MTPSLVELPELSPLSLNPLTRDTWGSYDCSAIAQMAGLANDPCYQLKLYKAPADNQESMAANAYVAYGLRITPDSVIFGFYLPSVVSPGDESAAQAPPFTVQITDTSLEHSWFDVPVASLFLSNQKPTMQSAYRLGAGSFPNLLPKPYPVVGTGLFMVEIQETSGEAQRIELVFGVFEVCR